MCIGAVVTCPGGGGGGNDAGAGCLCDVGGGGGADRADCAVGGPLKSFAEGGLEPFVRGWPSAPNAPESVADPADGVSPAAGGAAGMSEEARAGGVLMIASMLARSGSGASGAINDWADASGDASAELFSLSKTWVASWSSSQSMSSLAPFFAWTTGCAAGAGLLEGRTPGVGRVLAGAGTDGSRCVAFTCADAGGAASVGGVLLVEGRFGSDPRPGGGGGGMLGARAGAAAVAVETGAAAAGSDVDGCVAGPGGIGGCETGAADGIAGPGMPSSVRFASIGARAACRCDDEPGGGGGAAGRRSEAFFPRPSKISRSDPPPFDSFDIRVS